MFSNLVILRLKLKSKFFYLEVFCENTKIACFTAGNLNLDMQKCQVPNLSNFNNY